jgi:hypothetical protein
MGRCTYAEIVRPVSSFVRPEAESRPSRGRSSPRFATCSARARPTSPKSPRPRECGVKPCTGSRRTRLPPKRRLRHGDYELRQRGRMSSVVPKRTGRRLNASAIRTLVQRNRPRRYARCSARGARRALRCGRPECRCWQKWLSLTAFHAASRCSRQVQIACANKASFAMLIISGSRSERLNFRSLAIIW